MIERLDSNRIYPKRKAYPCLLQEFRQCKDTSHKGWLELCQARAKQGWTSDGTSRSPAASAVSTPTVRRPQCKADQAFHQRFRNSAAKLDTVLMPQKPRIQGESPMPDEHSNAENLPANCNWSTQPAADQLTSQKLESMAEDIAGSANEATRITAAAKPHALGQLAGQSQIHTAVPAQTKVQCTCRDHDATLPASSCNESSSDSPQEEEPAQQSTASDTQNLLTVASMERAVGLASARPTAEAKKVEDGTGSPDCYREKQAASGNGTSQTEHFAMPGLRLPIDDQQGSVSCSSPEEQPSPASKRGSVGFTVMLEPALSSRRPRLPSDSAHGIPGLTVFMTTSAVLTAHQVDCRCTKGTPKFTGLQHCSCKDCSMYLVL